MTARVIDGKAVARKLRQQYQGRVSRLLDKHGVSPGLAVILVGRNPASQLYVSNKVRACEEIGIRSERIEFPVDVDEALLLGGIDRLNADANSHGILVQLPLPAHIAMRRVLERISVTKDVDGFHLYNVGGLLTGSRCFSALHTLRRATAPAA